MRFILTLKRPGKNGVLTISGDSAQWEGTRRLVLAQRGIVVSLGCSAALNDAMKSAILRCADELEAAIFRPTAEQESPSATPSDGA